MAQGIIQSASQSLLSIFAPAIAFSVISAVLWAFVRAIQNDPKKPKYKQLPGPKGGRS